MNDRIFIPPALLLLLAFQGPQSVGATDTGPSPWDKCGIYESAKQKPREHAFKASELEFVSKPKPFSFEGMKGKAEFKMVARILNNSPFVIEQFDNDSSSSYIGDRHGISRIVTANSTEKSKIASLRLNDLIESSMLISGENMTNTKWVIGAIRKLSLPPQFWHEEDPYGNRSGTLIRYECPDTSLLIIFNDGSIYYRDTAFKAFSGQKLSCDELHNLLATFASSGFDALHNNDLPVGKVDEPSVTLICSRYQHVFVQGHETELARIRSQLESLKLRATSPISESTAGQA